MKRETDSRRFDVVIAGAGLPGLALATALARAGLRVALVDGAPIAAPPAVDVPLRPARLRHQPGQRRFLRAHRRLAAAAGRSRHADRGDAGRGRRGGARSTFSAYDLGERALAWIVEERELRAALLATALEAGVDVVGGTPFVGLTFDADERTLTLAGRGRAPRSLRGTAGRRRGRRSLVGAPGRRHRRRAAALRADRRRRQFRVRAGASRLARQWFRADGGVLAWLPLPGDGISIVWSAPDALAQELLALDAGGPRRPRGRRRAGTRSARLTLITPAAGFPAVACCACRRPSRIASRSSATPRTACTRWRARASTSDSATRRRSRRSLAERGPIADPGAPILLERYARRRAEPVLAMQTVTDGLARLFGPPSPWLSAVAQCRHGRRRSAADRQARACATRAALDCPTPLLPHFRRRTMIARSDQPRRGHRAVLAAVAAPAPALRAGATQGRRPADGARPRHQEDPRAEVPRRRGAQRHQDRRTSASTRSSSTTASSTPTRRSSTCSSARSTTPSPRST